MNRHPAMCHIKLQRAQVSNYWYASRRRYARNRQTLNYDLPKDCRDTKGDSVRMNKFKTVFDKSYTPN